MKVILLSDVKGRGKEGDVIEVARGFATNYLLPRNLATLATAGNLKQLESRMHNIHKREELKRGEAEGQAAQISGKSVVIEVKAGDGGKLFGSVTAGMVADALTSQLGVDVDRKKLDLHGHIKTVGEHTIDVRIYESVTAQLVLNVVPVGGAPEAGVTTKPETTAAEIVEAFDEAAAEEVVEDVKDDGDADEAAEGEDEAQE